MLCRGRGKYLCVKHYYFVIFFISGQLLHRKKFFTVKDKAIVHLQSRLVSNSAL